MGLRHGTFSTKETRTQKDLVRTHVGALLNWEGNSAIQQQLRRQQWMASKKPSRRAFVRKGKKKNRALGEI